MARFDVEEFRRERARMNEALLGQDHLGIKRFWALDARAYEPGALDAKTKELLGLVASTVLRCNDCIVYHLDQCHEVGATKEELLDALNVALVVGGSITIPHLRVAWDAVAQIYEGKKASELGAAGHAH
ncbi:MAG TPA: carboxymuconolactone decarboxylase family protein [Candidatus Thermoplasmatota archaeon]|jgi:AhpD family alkylhydroperoxidase|nr:carboxymuconolactone decarboxylase family protein [Candidatus Thermoplasmatota archaeon]